MTMCDLILGTGISSKRFEPLVSSSTLKDAIFSAMQARPTKHISQLHTLLMHKAR